MKKNEIQTLRQLKEAMANIPDKILDTFGFGAWGDSESVELMCWSEEPEGMYAEYVKKYPQIEEINKWIQNILKVHDKIDDDEDTTEVFEMDEPISSKDKIK